MRRAALLAPALLALAACSGGDDTGTPLASSTPATTSAVATTAPEDEAQAALADLCDTYCEQLQAASSTDCPEPEANVSLCVDYLTELILAVSEIDSAVTALPYSARDQAQLLEATRTALDASETFVGEQCYLITDIAAQGSVCGIRALTLRINASTVGLELEGASHP